MGRALVREMWEREVSRIGQSVPLTWERRDALEQCPSYEDTYIFYVREGGYRSALRADDILFWAAFSGGSFISEQCLEVLMMGSKPRSLHDGGAVGLLNFVMDKYPESSSSDQQTHPRFLRICLKVRTLSLIHISEPTRPY